MTYALKNMVTVIEDNPGEASLVIAFANLLERFGKSIDPTVLADDMTARGIEEVMLGSISIIDPTVQVSSFSGPGVPTTNDTIMRFDYTSPVTDQQTTIFCLIIDAEQGTIVDSWSGIEKNWSVYGGPGPFASYTNVPAEAPQEATAAAEMPIELVTVNDTTQPVQAAAEPETTPQVKKAVDIPVKIVPNSWQATYQKGLGVLDTTAIKNVVVTDLAGEQPDVQLHAGDVVYVAGRFKKDGLSYYRTVKSVENNTWYGVPAGSIIQTAKLQDDEDINDILLKDPQTPKEKIIKAAATAEGKTKRFFGLGRKK